MSRFSENVTEQLLRGVVTSDSVEVGSLLVAIRSEFTVAQLPRVGAALSEFVDPAAIAASSSVSAWTVSCEPAGGLTDVSLRPVAAPRGRRRALAGIGAFVGTFGGKIVFGTAVALAVTGGGQALGVLHLPGVDHRHPDPVHVVVSSPDRLDPATPTPGEVPITGNPRTVEPTLPGAGIEPTPGHEPGRGSAATSPDPRTGTDAAIAAGTPPDAANGLPSPPPAGPGDSTTPSAIPAIPHDSATPASDTTTTTPADQPAPDAAIDPPSPPSPPSPPPDGGGETTTTTSDTAPPDTGA